MEEEIRRRKEEEEKENEGKKPEEENKKEEKQILLNEKIKYQNVEEEMSQKEKEKDEKRTIELQKGERQEKADSNIESTTIELKENNISKKLRGTNQNKKEDDNNYNNIKNMKSNNKEEKSEEKNEESQKPKKKKVIKKVKKIIKIPKKNIETTDNRKPFCVSGSTSVNFGGIGHFHDNVKYTGHIPQSNFSQNVQNEYTNFQDKYNISQQNQKLKKKVNEKDSLLICDNCAHNINSENNKDIKTLRSYDYYQNMEDRKYDPINTKEFYELNRNRYLNRISKKESEGLQNDKTSIKSRSIEKVKINKINRLDEDSEFDRYINGFTTERYNVRDDNNDMNGNSGSKNNNANIRKIKRCRNNSVELRRNLRYGNGINDENMDNRNMINGMNNLDEENNNNEFNNNQRNLRLRMQKNINDNFELMNNKININNDEIEIFDDVNNKNDNKNNKIDNIKNTNINELKEIDCPRCKNSYVLTKDIRFYNCIDCNNIMCGKCSKDHYLKYPEHHCSNTDINGITINLSSEFNNINNNININSDKQNNNINNTKIKESKKRKLNVRKYINKSQNQKEEMVINNMNNEIIIPDNNVKITLLNENNMNQSYYNNNNNNMRKEQNGGEYYYDDCFLCGIKQRENYQDKFFICRECDRLLCENCKNKHDLINPEHNLVISYISGEIDKDTTNNIEQKEHICNNCQYKLNNNLEEEINPPANYEANINNDLNIN